MTEKQEHVARIRFTNPEGALYGLDLDGFNDETEFDTWDEDELAQLWWEFCKENNVIEVYKE